MQTVPKTAEEAATLYLDTNKPPVRKFVQNHGRTLARKLIIALWDRNWDKDRQESTVMFFMEMGSRRSEIRVKELIKAL